MQLETANLGKKAAFTCVYERLGLVKCCDELKCEFF